jgi:predicted short-subunit dehydrogenase-like oxidoreductase (DUF2520 family)
MKRLLKVGFIGTGTVGSALAQALNDCGYPVVAVSSRNSISATKLAGNIEGCRAFARNQQVADAAELLFIATPDDVIAQTVELLKWRQGQSIVHLSGADSSQILSAAKMYGACVGVFHPLQTFAGGHKVIDKLPGITYSLEAEEPLLATLKDIVDDLGGHWIELKSQDRALYHVAAVFACNYLVTLVKLSTDLWHTFGVTSEEAIRALLPLLKETVESIDGIGLPNCLTGPIARGDSGTIKKHLAALENKTPELVAIYRELAEKTIPIALAKGRIDSEKAAALRAVIAL